MNSAMQSVFLVFFPNNSAKTNFGTVKLGYKSAKFGHYTFF